MQEQKKTKIHKNSNHTGKKTTIQGKSFVARSSRNEAFFSRVWRRSVREFREERRKREKKKKRLAVKATNTLLQYRVEYRKKERERKVGLNGERVILQMYYQRRRVEGKLKQKPFYNEWGPTTSTGNLNRQISWLLFDYVVLVC